MLGRAPFTSFARPPTQSERFHYRVANLWFLVVSVKSLDDDTKDRLRIWAKACNRKRVHADGETCGGAAGV
jgi:hypothetical protein